MQNSSDIQLQPEPQPAPPERGRAWRIVAIVLTLHAALLGGVVLIQGCGRSEPLNTAETSPLVEPPKQVLTLGEDLSPQANLPTPLPGSEVLTPEEHLAGSETAQSPAQALIPMAEHPAEKVEETPVKELSTIATFQAVEHAVQKGDTLTKIARKYTVSVRELATANKITGKSPLKVGQKLVVPNVKNTNTAGGRKPSTVVRAMPAGGKTVIGQVHRVKSGETPTSIAKRYGVSVQVLLQANNIRDPKRIRVNQKLVIPVLKVIQEAPAMTPVISPELQKEMDVRPTVTEEPAAIGQQVNGI